MTDSTRPLKTGASLTVTLMKGPTGKKGFQRRILTCLGLHKTGSFVTVPDSPTMRGMVQKVLHLVRVS